MLEKRGGLEKGCVRKVGCVRKEGRVREGVCEKREAG